MLNSVFTEFNMSVKYEGATNTLKQGTKIQDVSGHNQGITHHITPIKLESSLLPVILGLNKRVINLLICQKRLSVLLKVYYFNKVNKLLLLGIDSQFYL